MSLTKFGFKLLKKKKKNVFMPLIYLEIREFKFLIFYI